MSDFHADVDHWQAGIYDWQGIGPPKRSPGSVVAAKDLLEPARKFSV